MVQRKLKYLVLFLLMVIFISCNSAVTENKIDNPTTGQVLAPNIEDKGNVELANGEETIIRFRNTGSAITSCTVSPSLPSGLSLSSDCTIRGTVTSSQPRTSYVVTGRNSAGSSNANIEITVITVTSSTVRLSGTITYDSVPFKSGLVSGLDYNNISRKAVRGALVEIVNQENCLLQQRLMPLVLILFLLQEEVRKYVFWLS